jgi:hypothetical protein
MAFILDNSVASGWFLENQASPYTEAIAARLNEDTAHAPARSGSWSWPTCCEQPACVDA